MVVTIKVVVAARHTARETPAASSESILIESCKPIASSGGEKGLDVRDVKMRVIHMIPKRKRGIMGGHMMDTRIFGIRFRRFAVRSLLRAEHSRGADNRFDTKCSAKR